MNVGSLFSGIGGFDLGLERAGMRTVWQVEQDEFCRRVLARHFPDAERYVDVRDVGSANLSSVDVICGGFPCQDISVAGRGAGIDGEQSSLWAEMFRVVGELRPRYVVVENVAALVTRGLDRVLGDLAEIGYDAEWDCLRAADFDAPHLRARLWLVAYPGGSGRWEDGRGALGDEGADEGRPSGDDHVPDGDGQGSRAGAVAHANGASEDAVGTPVTWVQRHPWAAEPDVARMAHGIPNGLDRRRALGNSLVPQIAEWIGRRIIKAEQEMSAVA